MENKKTTKPLFESTKSNKKVTAPSHSSSSESSSSSDSEDYQIDEDQLNFNKILLEAQNLYSSHERTLAFEKYKQALEFAQKLRDPEKIAHLKTNIAIISFENGEYKTSLTQMEEALSILSAITKGELLLEIKLKILSSLCVVCLVLNQYDRSRDYSRKITTLLQTINPLSKKKAAMELVVFSLYKFVNFPSMQNLSLENIEEIYQGVPLACFYSTLGLNRELNNEPHEALNYYIKALDAWKNCNEIGFVLITLKHLINLSPKAGLNVADTANFMKLYQKLLQADEFKGINVENMFKDYEQRLEIAKEITLNLRSFEETILFSDEKDKSLDKSPLSVSQEIIPNNFSSFSLEPLWKQALRLRLLKSLKMARALISNPSNSHTKTQYIELLGMGTDQILKTLAVLKEESNPIILNKLQTLTYTKEAVTSIRAAVNKLRKFLNFMIYSPPFNKLIRQSEKKALALLKKSQFSSLISKAYNIVLQGDYLIKCNNKSNERSRKFYKLSVDGKLYVASKEIYIDNESKHRELDLAEVLGLTYGKSTPTLLKQYNKPLESHLCFSLIQINKTLDFYCGENQIKPWIFTLSREIKKKNPSAFCYNPGKLLWLGFGFRLQEEYLKILEKGSKIKGKKTVSLVKALLFFAKTLKK